MNRWVVVFRERDSGEMHAVKVRAATAFLAEQEALVALSSRMERHAMPGSWSVWSITRGGK